MAKTAVIYRKLLTNSVCGKEHNKLLAFYLAIKSLSHNGSIHHYRRHTVTIGNKLNISDRTFRQRVADCKRVGLLRVCESGHLWHESQKRIAIRKGVFEDLSLRPKKEKIKHSASKCRKIKYETLKELQFMLKLHVVKKKKDQMEYQSERNERNFRSKRLPKCIGTNSGFEIINSKPAPSNISRMSIASLLGYKSASTASRIIKKAHSLRLLEDKGSIYVFNSNGSLDRFVKDFKGVKATFFKPSKKNKNYGKFCLRQCNNIRILFT